MKNNQTAQIKLKRSDSNLYDVVEHNDRNLCMLGEFLGEIVSRLTYTHFTDWLEGKYNQDYAFSNAYGLIEHEGRIYACFIYDSEEERLSYFSTSSKKIMLDIINQWASVLNQDPRPKDIVITQDVDGEVFIKAIEE